MSNQGWIKSNLGYAYKVDYVTPMSQEASSWKPDERKSVVVKVVCISAYKQRRIGCKQERRVSSWGKEANIIFKQEDARSITRHPSWVFKIFDLSKILLKIENIST